MKSNYSKIRIIINDDQDIFREGACEIIKAHPEFELVAILTSGENLINVVRNHRPDVVITAVQSAETDSATATNAITEQFPQTGVLAISMFHQEQNIIKMLRAGAKGCLLRSARKSELLEAIKAIYQMESYFSQPIIAKLGNLIANNEFAKLGLTNVPQLTQKDKIFLQLLCREYTIKEIASHFHISIRSVEHRKEKLYEFLNKKNIAGLINYAIQSGLYDPFEARKSA